MNSAQATEDNGATGVPRRRPLNSLRDVQRQIATIYWDARRGRIEAATATKLTYVLGRLADVIGDGEIEKRLGELEARLVATHVSE